MKERVLQELYKIGQEIKLLEHSIALLGWDQETYMPETAIEERASQLGLLETILHTKRTSSELGNLFFELGATDKTPSGNDDLSPFEKSFVRVFYKDYRKYTMLPSELIAKLAHKASITQNVWVKARKTSDFSFFAPHLEELLELVREKADRLGYENHPYDALLDEYEPGTKTETVQNVFKTAKQDITELLSRITAAKQLDDAVIYRNYPIDQQKAFSELVLQDLGFELSRGRMDISVHPFTTTLGSNDVRLTTRYQEDYFNSGIFSVVHEGGHGLYEQGFSKEIQGNILSDGTSLGIHESQSRMWENFIGRSYPFWHYYYPMLRNYFPKNFQDVTLDAFYRAINRVEPSFIRVEADEVTYNLHIILRFELETKLITGELAVKDLPEAWNSASAELFGIVPENDAQGVLQDIHWSMGAFGYFPTYALGNLYAAQFFQSMEKELPDCTKKISQGSFEGILYWLREKIHRHGRIFDAEELCFRISGEQLNPCYFTDYLIKKYSELYGL